VTDETKELMEKARALLAAATPGPWRAGCHYLDGECAATGPVHVVDGYGRIAEEKVSEAASYDAELIAFAVNNLPALLDAIAGAETRVAEIEDRRWMLQQELEGARDMLPDAFRGPDNTVACGIHDCVVSLDCARRTAEKRADEAEAACAATLTEMQSAAHRLWKLPPADRTLATDDVWRALSHFKPPVAGAAFLARLHAAEKRADEAEAGAAAWRQHTAALVAAMKTWGSWEDGVPCESDGGEYGEVGAAFNAAHDALHPGGNFASWRCSSCGETATMKDSSWRWNGTAWQHTHADSPQAGHFDAVYADPARALLDRLHAAKRERDEASAEVEKESALRAELTADAWRLHAEVDRLAGWDVCPASVGGATLTLPAAEDPPAEVVPEGATCAENELAAAWAATGVAGQVRGLTTLADVVATHRSEVLAHRALKAELIKMADAGENFRPGDTEDMGAWITKTVRRLRSLVEAESQR